MTKNNDRCEKCNGKMIKLKSFWNGGYIKQEARCKRCGNIKEISRRKCKLW